MVLLVAGGGLWWILDHRASQAAASEPAPLPDPRQFPGQGVCKATCRISSYTAFTHPAWGPSNLVTTESLDKENLESNIVVTDRSGRVRWHHFGGAWYELAVASPTSDKTGNLFLNFNPGRYNGVIILRPTKTGFENFDSLPPEDDYRGAFYYAERSDVNDDGIFEIDQSSNDCDPDCAGGKISHEIYHWTGKGYQR